MKLPETIELMCSTDYKERFRAEYFQLTIRMAGLEEMLKKYKKETLTFKPSCSYELLEAQLISMERYRMYLETRADIENINLEELKSE